MPDLAVALPSVSDGGRTYAFRLRPGIRYSTGALVGRRTSAAESIVRCLQLGLALQLRRDRRRGSMRRGTEALRPRERDRDRHRAEHRCHSTSRIRTPTSSTSWRCPSPTPCRRARRSKAHLPLPATGPYEIARIDAKRGVIRLVRNPRFHLWSAAAQPDGFPDQIVERYGYTGESAVRAVERGTADITSDGIDQTWTPALASSLRTRYSSRLYTTPTMNITAVWLNTRLPPFDDVRVRQALNYAVDRNHLIELAGGPTVAQVGCQMLAAERRRVPALLPIHAPPQRAPEPTTGPTSRRRDASWRHPERRDNRSPSGSSTSRSADGTAPTSSRCSEASATTRIAG